MTASPANAVTFETYEPRSELLLASWLRRPLPPRDFFLGNVLCSTSRWILWGETGVGKTLFALDLAAAVASGKAFLGWEGRRRGARVMYLDGEMPAETFKERMEFVAQRYGPDLRLFGYNRDVLSEGDLPPLDTPEGQSWLWREIDVIKPDFIVFDAIMCLTIGLMGEEESWAPMKPLMRKLSRGRIAQLWLHHTGHDTGKAFGTKTREWEMDTVVSLKKGDENGDSVALEFKKARLRTLENRHQFEARLIRCEEAGWVSLSPLTTNKKTQSSEANALKKEVLNAYDRLADSVPSQAGCDYGATIRVGAARQSG
jgi:RecA-family ATPase